MSGDFHFVCTADEAEGLIGEHGHYWVSACRCRELRGPCKRSRSDVCVQFAPGTPADGPGIHADGPGIHADGPGIHAATREEVDAILREARERHLVPRPFRGEGGRVDGICFCCDDCCGYFRGLEGPCEKGRMIELTDPAACIDCGVCAGVCHFGARDASGAALRVDRDRCYGCGTCADVCAMKAISMVPRP